MADEIIKQNKPADRFPRNDAPRNRFPRGDRKGGGRTFADRPKPEFDQKMIDLRRVTRVVAGGRRMSFAVVLVIGDRKGGIGLGTGKAIDTTLAIGKALKTAKKNMFKVNMTKDMSIPHEVSAKYASSKVELRPNRGRGLVAGSAARTILSLGGITNITAKFHSGTKNKLNNARATMLALSMVSKPKKSPVAVIPEVSEMAEVKS